jgi:hypothetical protein
MGAEIAGRKLGIGLRLAAKAVQQRATRYATAPISSNTPGKAQEAYRTPSAPPAATRAAAQAQSATKAVARGTKRFGQAIWGPMAHTGGVLWLEITGLFFALFAIFFGQNAYRMRHNYASGPEHAHFLIYSALTGLFAWFTASSFYRARLKEKKNRARQAAR